MFNSLIIMHYLQRNISNHRLRPVTSQYDSSESSRTKEFNYFITISNMISTNLKTKEVSISTKSKTLLQMKRRLYRHEKSMFLSASGECQTKLSWSSRLALLTSFQLCDMSFLLFLVYKSADSRLYYEAWLNGFIYRFRLFGVPTHLGLKQ